MATMQKRGKTSIDPDITIAGVRTDDTMLWITLTDGRVIGAPLEWFPRLQDATPAQRAEWELQSEGSGIHWSAVDEDISARVLMGHPS
jgi:hypothetical protein